MLKTIKEISDKLDSLEGKEIRLGLRSVNIRTSRPIIIMGSYTTSKELYIVEEDEIETILELNEVLDVWLGEYGSTMTYKDGSRVDFSWDSI